MVTLCSCATNYLNCSVASLVMASFIIIIMIIKIFEHMDIDTWVELRSVLVKCNVEG